MNSRHNHYYINIDCVATELGAGFTREMVLKLATEGDFSILYIPTEDFEDKKIINTPYTIDHAKINKLMNGNDLPSPYTKHSKNITFQELYVTREKIDAFKGEKLFKREEINKREPVFCDDSGFQNHPFYVPELQYAIKTWQAIYLQPDNNVSDCEKDRKRHTKLIEKQIQYNAFQGNCTDNFRKDLVYLINPIPFGTQPDTRITTLPEETFLNPRDRNREPPLYNNHDIASEHPYYPIELYLSIEAWIHIFAYAPKNYIKEKPLGSMYYITNWLRVNFNGLNDKIYRRIASFANPDRRS